MFTKLIIIFIVVLFFLGIIYVVVRLSKAITEEKVKSFSKIGSVTNYVMFASNFKKAEEFEKMNKLADAKEYYKAALRNLKEIDLKDDLVIENINKIEEKLKKLDI